MEIRHLRYFLTLSEELHFRRASEKLHIAQPALTRQIKELENQLGVVLFKRDRRNVALSPAGKFLQEEGYKIMKQLAFVEGSISEMGISISGQINMGCIGSAMITIIPDLVTKMETTLPGIRTNIVEATTQDLLNLMMDGQIDMMFTRPLPPQTRITSKLVHQESTVLAIARNNPWGIHKESPIKELKEVPFILFPRHAGPSFRDQILYTCAKNGFHPNIKHESIHSLSILKLVEKGLGISIIPKSLTQAYDLDVVYISHKELEIPLDLMASYRTDNQDQITKQIIGLL